MTLRIADGRVLGNVGIARQTSATPDPAAGAVLR